MKPYLLSLPPTVSPSLSLSLSHSLFSLSVSPPSFSWPATSASLPRPAAGLSLSCSAWPRGQHRQLHLHACRQLLPHACRRSDPARGGARRRAGRARRRTGAADRARRACRKAASGSIARRWKGRLPGFFPADGDHLPQPSSPAAPSLPLGASGCICGRGAGGRGRAGEDMPMELGYWAVSHTDTYPILSFWAQYSPVHRYGLDTYPQRICSVSVSDTYRIRDTAAPPRIRVFELHFVFM